MRHRTPSPVEVVGASDQITGQGIVGYVILVGSVEASGKLREEGHRRKGGIMPRRIITALAAATALAFGAACADDAPPAAPPVTEAPAPAPEPVPEPARHEGPWYDLLDDSHGYIGGARLNDAWAELVVAQDGAGGLPPELWPEAVLIDVRRALAAVDRALVAERRYTDAAAYDRLAKLEANQAEMRALLP